MRRYALSRPGSGFAARSGTWPYRQPVWPSHAAAYGLIVGLAGAARLFGVDLASPGAMIGLCTSILVAGLPHGALDITVLTRQAPGNKRIFHGLVALYLACAAATLGLWEMSPVAALAGFLLIAIIHFADDWRLGDTDQTTDGYGFFAVGTSLALLSVPNLVHNDAIRGLFVALTNDPAARYVADGMLLVAPVGCCMALAAMIIDGEARRFDQLAVKLATVLAMLVLPPLVGFALYFCLFHSPRHLAQGLRRCGTDPRQMIGRTVVPVTGAALGIAALVYELSPRASLAAAAVPTAFMTLSLLTVPHMLVPILFAKWQHRFGPAPHGPLAEAAQRRRMR